MMRLLLGACAALIGMFLSLPLLVIGLPFWAVAFLTRKLGDRLRPQAAPWHAIIQFDPTVGWKPKPALNVYCSFAAGTFHVKTDAQGWRGQTSLDESHIVVFGDSVAFGYGVDENRTFFSNGNGGPRIKAIGCPGYNMVQELLWMRGVAAHLRDKVVVWFIYHGNDLYDNLIPNLSIYRMPFVRQVNGAGSWEIVKNHVGATSWPSPGEHNLRLREKWMATFVAGAAASRAFDACEFLLEQGRDLCHSVDAALVVVSVPIPNQLDRARWRRVMARYGDPDIFDPRLPDRELTEICSRLGVPLVIAGDFLEASHHIPIDGHWNENGHRQIKSVLEGLYQKYAAEKDRQRHGMNCAAHTAASLQSHAAGGTRP